MPRSPVEWTPKAVDDLARHTTIIRICTTRSLPSRRRLIASSRKTRDNLASAIRIPMILTALKWGLHWNPSAPSCWSASSSNLGTSSKSSHSSQ